MEILKPTKENIIFLAQELRKNQLVAMPTETVYGLAGDAKSEIAVSSIYKAKNRPSFNPLIAHYANIECLKKDVIFNDLAEKLASHFMPGPLTLVMKKNPKTKNICSAATAGLKTIAVRIPAHDIAHDLLTEFNGSLVAPSANISGCLSPVTAEQILASKITGLKWILDGGKTIKGLESTIIDVTEKIPVILRFGSIGDDAIRAVVGDLAYFNKHDKRQKINAPGMGLKHYAPSCPVRLSTDNPQNGEALLAFGNENIPQNFSFILNLSEQASIDEAASNLFDYLYQLDKMGASQIAVMPIPNIGIGKAINDRLTRAAEV